MKPKIALHIIAVQRELISERNRLQKGGSQLELAELDIFLRNEESIETLQREQGMNINDLNLAYHLQTPPKIHRGDLFQQEIFISVNTVDMRKFPSIHMILLKSIICIAVHVYKLLMEKG